MGTQDHTIKIFVSSPGDVEEERLIAQRVLKRLADQLLRVVQIESIFWEHEPLVATQNFQAGISSPADSDIVLCILWARIGTRLPPSIHRPDGSPYASGTEYEFETAVEGHRQHGQPDLLVYRKTAQPDPKAKGPEDLITFGEQWRALDGFVKKWFHGEDGTLIAAFHPFQEPASFEQILEVHLRKLIEKRLATWGLSPDVTRLPPPPSWTLGSPFRGLEVFEFEHAPVFFGRTKAVSEVLAALRRQARERRAFLLILGGSGCGKSSLVRAGVLPILTQPGVIEGVGLWRRAVMRPAAASRSGPLPADPPLEKSTSDKSGDLFDSLAAALIDPAALPELTADGTSMERLAEMLRKNPAGAFGLVKGALSQAAALVKPAKEAKAQPEARLVLVVDQLEEIFSDKRFTAAGREALFVALADLTQSGKVWVIATLRSDFYHRCQEIPDLVALKGADGQLDLSPPTPVEIGQMIRQPAAAAGLQFDVDPQTSQPLDDALQNEAAGIKEGLPLLEFALDELYRHSVAKDTANVESTHASTLVLEFADYRALKGLSGCLAERAEQTFQELDEKARGVFAKVFRKLVVLASAEKTPTRRIAPMSEFEHEPSMTDFVARFVKARLFTADRAVGPDGGATVRIAHEALLTTAEWNRLRDWLSHDRENLQMHGRLGAAASRWNEAGRTSDLLLQPGKPLDEARQLEAAQFELSLIDRSLIDASERQARRVRLAKRSAVAALVVLTILALVGGSVAEYQRRWANVARADADQNARRADQNAHRADDNAARASDAARNARNAQTAAELQRKEAFILRDRAERRLYASQIAAALRDWETNNAAGAWQDLSSTRSDLRGWEYDYLLALFNKNQLTLRGHTAAVMSVAFSSDDKRIVSGSEDGTIRVWDARNGRKMLTWKAHAGGVYGVAFDSDGKRIASAGSDNFVKVWDVTSGRELLVKRGHTSVVSSIAFSPDGKRIVSGSWDNTAKIWNATSGKMMLTLNGHTHAVLSVAFSPDGKRIASGSYDKTLKVWDAASGKEGQTIAGHGGGVTSVAFSPDGKRIVSGSLDTTVKVWDVNSGQQTLSIKENEAVFSVAYSPDGTRILSGLAEAILREYKAANGQQTGTFSGHTSWVMSVAFSPGGKRVVSGSVDATLKVWDVLRDYETLTLKGHSSIVTSLAFSPDGSRIVSGSADKTLRLWETTSGRETLILREHGDQVTTVAFSPDGKRIASGSADTTIKVRDASSGKVTLTFKEHTTSVTGVAFSPDGKRIASASGDWRVTGDNTVKVWDATSGQVTLTLRGHTGYVSCVAFSPDGKWIASGSSDKTVKVWDASSGHETLTFREHTAGPMSLAFSPDGKWIVSGGSDKTVKVWDASSGHEIHTLTGHSGYVSSVAFSPDGKRIASGSWDKTVMVWDAMSGQQTLVLKGHTGQIWSVAFSPDGKRIVSAGRDDTLKVWDASVTHDGRTLDPSSMPFEYPSIYWE